MIKKKKYSQQYFFPFSPSKKLILWFQSQVCSRFLDSIIVPVCNCCNRPRIWYACIDHGSEVWPFPRTSLRLMWAYRLDRALWEGWSILPCSCMINIVSPSAQTYLAVYVTFDFQRHKDAQFYCGVNNLLCHFLKLPPQIWGKREFH